MDNQNNIELQFNLNAFNVCCTQVHKTKYSMNMQYPIMDNLEIIWALYHIFWNLKKHCVTLTKPRRNAIPSLGYTITPWAELFWSKLLEGYYSCPKGLTKHAIPLLGYPRNTLGFITYLLTRGGVLCNLMKTNEETNTLINKACDHVYINVRWNYYYKTRPKICQCGKIAIH